ncbi:TPA: phage protein NinX family protein [Citrobacter freundii]
MDYSKLSDFEVNAAVFEALHGGAPDYKEGDGGAMVLISYEGDVVGGDTVEVEVERGAFNPCNNPADAWPIIVDKKIGLKPVRWNEWRAEGDDSCGFLSYTQTDKNPLRAAMIVFLMMQDSANVQDNPA